MNLLGALVLLGASLAWIDEKLRERREAEQEAALDYAVRAELPHPCLARRCGVVGIRKRPCPGDHSNSVYGVLGLRRPRTLRERAWEGIWSLKDAGKKVILAASYKK